jgi:hypothetical protein
MSATGSLFDLVAFSKYVKALDSESLWDIYQDVQMMTTEPGRTGETRDLILRLVVIRKELKNRDFQADLPA